jgi:nitroimidazol reductase NimA-like FMN-containing flavoprotein (pyridoxamine 5'-phosphate oxidase superfamily)
MNTEKIQDVLSKREFVSIATADRNGTPNSVPKFFFRARGHFIYLVDYVLGQTVTNLRVNPKVSVSFMDMDTLEAYRLNGTATIIEKGRPYDAFLKEWNERLLKLSVDRVVEAVKTGKKRGTYELEMSQKFAVLKIKVESIVKINRKGDFWQEAS